MGDQDDRGPLSIIWRWRRLFTPGDRANLRCMCVLIVAVLLGVAGIVALGSQSRRLQLY